MEKKFYIVNKLLSKNGSTKIAEMNAFNFNALKIHKSSVQIFTNSVLTLDKLYLWFFDLLFDFITL